MKSNEDVSTFGSLSPAGNFKLTTCQYLPKLKLPHSATVHQGQQGLNVVLDLFFLCCSSLVDKENGIVSDYLTLYIVDFHIAS